MPQLSCVDDLESLQTHLNTSSEQVLVIYELPETITIPDKILSILVDEHEDCAILCIGSEEPPFDLEALDSLIEFIFEKDLSSTSITVALRSLVARQDAFRTIRTSEEKLQTYASELNLIELGAGIAHDANNMLGASLGHLQQLETALDDTKDEALTNHLSSAISGCRHVASLLQEWLSEAKGSNSERKTEQRQAADILKHISNIVRPLIPSHITFKAHHTTELEVNCIAHQLEQALLNLILNAVQAIPESGNIHLSASRAENASESKVIFEIIDTGCGIPEHKIQQIFNPFYSSKEKKGGSGLGLAMVNRIVHEHNGELYLHSEVGTGTCIKIVLPAEESTRQQSSPVETTMIEMTGQILIIDDSILLLEVIDEFLSDAGLHAVTFSNPKEAIHWYAHNHMQTDLILLDMQMPEMNGEECFHALRKIDSDAPITIYSGAQDKASDVLLESGAIEFFQKPLDYRKTTEWIQRYLISSSVS